MEKNLGKIARVLSDEFLQFMSKAVSPFHVVEIAKSMLNSAGFKEVHECENWDI